MEAGRWKRLVSGCKTEGGRCNRKRGRWKNQSVKEKLREADVYVGKIKRGRMIEEPVSGRETEGGRCIYVGKDKEREGDGRVT